MKTLRMGQMVVAEYVRSGRLLPELLLLVAAVAFLRLGAPSPIIASLAVGVAAILLAILITYRTTTWANGSLGYMLIARPLGRIGYLLGTLLASWLMVEVCFLVLRLAAWPALPVGGGDLLRTALPMALALSLVVVVVAFLSPLVAGSEWLRTGFIVLLALSVYRDDLGQWNEWVRRGLQAFWMTFAVPVLGALNLSAEWGYAMPTRWLVGVTLVETVLILAAMLIFFSQRELDWD